jgi:hypothetical protein
MRRTAAAAAVLLGLAAPSALAAPAALAERACFVSDSGFEEKVAHLDIDICPGTRMKPDKGCCRAALEGSAGPVYTFRHTEAEPCFARVDGWDFEDIAGRFGIVYDNP